MRKRWLPLLMFIIIFVTCFSGFTSYAASSYESDPAISIDVSYGVGEGIKYGRYLPLYMTINSRVKVQKVTMQMSIPRIDGEITLYEESFSLLPEVEEELAFYVPLMYGSDTIYLRMLDEDEKVIANKTLSLEVPKNYGEVFAGYINGEEEIIQYFDDLVLSGNNSLGLNIFSLTPDQIPEHWLGLDMLDIIFVAGTLTDFEEDIQKVITDWVENGGILVLLPAEEVSRQTAGLTQSSSLERNPLGKGAEISLEYTLNDLKNSCEYRGNREEAADFFYQLIGETKEQEILNESYGWSVDYDNYSSLTDVVAATKIPSVGRYALILIIYLCVSGPFMYLLLKHYRKTRWQKSVIAAMALLFTFLIYCAGTDTRYQNTFVTYSRFVEMGEETLDETIFWGLRSPKNGSTDVVVDGSFDTVPLMQNCNDLSQEQMQAEKSETYDYNERISYGTDTTIGIKDLVAFTSKSFYSEKETSNSEGLGISCQVNLYENELSGSIYNHTGRDLKNVAIVFYGQEIMIGSMIDGETIDLEGKELMDSGDIYTQARRLAGIQDKDDESLEKASSLANLISYYLQQNLYQAGSPAKVIALSEEENTSFIKSGNVELYGATLYVDDVEVNNIKGESEYLQSPETEPEVVDGNYYGAYENFMYGESITLDYELGEEYEIEEISFKENNSLLDYNHYRKKFSGECSIYNVNTGQYERIDYQNGSYSGDRLKNYLTADNHIQIRYEDPENIENYYTIMLPRMSYIRRSVDAGD